MTDRSAPREPSRATLRASDADRDAVAAVLSEALAEGRLDMAEYEQRLDRAMQAATIGELEPLTGDLPGASGGQMVDLAAQAELQPSSRWREAFDMWRSWLGGAVIMVGIWLAVGVAGGEFGNFWPAIPLGIWAAINVASIFHGNDGCDDR